MILLSPIRGEINIIRVTLQVYVLKSSACMGELYLTRLAIVYGIVTATGAVYNVLFIFSSPNLILNSNLWYRLLCLIIFNY